MSIERWEREHALLRVPVESWPHPPFPQALVASRAPCRCRRGAWRAALPMTVKSPGVLLTTDHVARGRGGGVCLRDEYNGGGGTNPPPQITK